jgi:hypothetical protein
LLTCSLTPYSFSSITYMYFRTKAFVQSLCLVYMERLPIKSVYI